MRTIRRMKVKVDERRNLPLHSPLLVKGAAPQETALFRLQNMTFGSITIPAFLATGVYNLDGSRFDRAPLDTRKEGWTEAWGCDDGKKQNDSVWNTVDEQAIQMLLATPHPQIPLVLTQFRPAYFEQLFLRIAAIPHIVVNSPYISNEATGPLPYLRDYQTIPALVGRQHPSNIAPLNPKCNNSILDYLMSTRAINLDASLATTEQKIMSKCLMTLISAELEDIVVFLRYEDHDAFEQVYRGRYLQASSLYHGTWISNLKGRFQACMERAVSRRRGIEYNKTTSIRQAVQNAKEAYQMLEDQLTSHNQPYLLKTDKPSLVDVALWAHLADALCDVHLVVVLSCFPELVQYFQHMYKTYFPGNLGAWDQWNLKQNLENSFQDIPMDGGKKLSAKSSYTDAIELMQSLSMRKQDLQEVLDAAKAKRKEESWPETPKPTESLLYRWRMGEDPGKYAETSDPQEKSNPGRKKMIREQERNDQIWISGVAGVSILVVFALQGAASQSS